MPYAFLDGDFIQISRVADVVVVNDPRRLPAASKRSIYTLVLINGVVAQACVDSGAMSTVLSKQFCDQHGILVVEEVGAVYDFMGRRATRFGVATAELRNGSFKGQLLLLVTDAVIIGLDLFAVLGFKMLVVVDAFTG